MCQWDTRELPDGVYSLRLTVIERGGERHVAHTTVQLANNGRGIEPTVAPRPTPELTLIFEPLSRPRRTRRPPRESTE